MKLFLVLASLFTSALSFAGESGVIFQGKSYILFKDGKKVSDLPEEVRKPASLASSSWLSIRYEKDTEHGVICYYNYDAPDKSAALSCVKVK